MASFGSPAATATATGVGRPAKTLDPADCVVPCPAGNDGISSLTWSPTANILVSSNWDGSVSCWEVEVAGTQARANPKAQVTHEPGSSVLDTCFSADGGTVFSCGSDKAVRMWPLGGAAPPTNVAQQIGAHDTPVKSVGFLRASNLVVSGGWDRKLKFWDTRSPTPAGVFELPERVYDLDVRDNLMVVATAGRHIIAYNVSGPSPVEHSRMESPLKFQSRCVSCFTDSTGFAVGSIEGRVGIHYLQKVPGKDSFAFKCHRQESNVFAVNSISFNNQFGTFSTVGSDGVVNFWDKDNKQRLKGFNPIERTIPCASFNAQGNLFAYASSYDWSKGSMHVQQGNEIFIHYVLEDEIRPKAKKSTSSGGYKR